MFLLVSLLKTKDTGHKPNSQEEFDAMVRCSGNQGESSDA